MATVDGIKLHIGSWLVLTSPSHTEQAIYIGTTCLNCRSPPALPCINHTCIANPETICLNSNRTYDIITHAVVIANAITHVRCPPKSSGPAVRVESLASVLGQYGVKVQKYPKKTYVVSDDGIRANALSRLDMGRLLGLPCPWMDADAAGKAWVMWCLTGWCVNGTSFKVRRPVPGDVIYKRFSGVWGEKIDNDQMQQLKKIGFALRHWCIYVGTCCVFCALFPISSEPNSHKPWFPIHTQHLLVCPHCKHPLQPNMVLDRLNEWTNFPDAVEPDPKRKFCVRLTTLDSFLIADQYVYLDNRICGKDNAGRGTIRAIKSMGTKWRRKWRPDSVPDGVDWTLRRAFGELWRLKFPEGEGYNMIRNSCESSKVMAITGAAIGITIGIAWRHHNYTHDIMPRATISDIILPVLSALTFAAICGCMAHYLANKYLESEESLPVPDPTEDAGSAKERIRSDRALLERFFDDYGLR
ncbi:hypothetical protein SmJEL517_g05290 [Synchytrium microbalum]|uniref:Uncharacterized protein n=1 Tax=Synchytrium microbalum TaxID=1806994 RepID=A0A507BV21_9FUNG|nr:uncharacterized protein SmJEL517_g05290 [Synchytrium microbalum]TPX31372.1 hypothetical protein SmJEL517_g05290 [Synchytrium microbalum]